MPPLEFLIGTTIGVPVILSFIWIGQYLFIDRNGISGAIDFPSETSVGRFIYFTGNPNLTSIAIHNVEGTVGVGTGVSVA